MSKDEYYSQFRGIVRSVPSADAPQTSHLILDNYVINRVKGGMMKRAGSKTWAATGDCLGMGEYSKDSTSLRQPNVSYVIRHMRSGGASAFSYYDWTTDAWIAITLGASTSFATNGITTFAMVGQMLAVCGGRPAKLTDPIAGTMTRLGGPAPTAAPTWGNSGTGLTGTTTGFYTFYDSTTGWESSPSPITASLTISNKQIDWSAMETTCAREGVDKKRLYRTQLASSASGPYYRVTEIALATTTYSDTIADASLGAAGPAIGDHDPPPTDCYLCVEYGNYVWIASGSSLYYSNAFDGNNYQLEYYSQARVFRFPARIMGLAYSADFGRLLVFCPPGYGIHYISGLSNATFTQGVFSKKEGTNFPTSIEIHEQHCAYWGTNGPSLIDTSGVVKTFGDDINEAVRSVATGSYSGDIHIFCRWQPVLKQFLWFVSATDTGTSVPWGEVVANADVQWEDISAGSVVTWG